MTRASQETVFDTGQQHLGAIYAKALLGVGEKTGTTESLVEELEAFVGDVLDALPALEATLSSARVPPEAKEQILDRALGERMSRQLLNFLKVVAARGRFDCMRAIARATRQRFNELRGRLEVEVRSAEPLDDTTREQVIQTLQQRLGREVDLRLGVDPDLIGGLVVRVGDTVYDGSLANRLQRFRVDLVDKMAQRIAAQLDRFALAE